jgi:membrane protein
MAIAAMGGPACHHARSPTSMPETVLDRAARAVEGSRLAVFGVNLPLLLVNVVRQFMEVRVMGLSAEMTYYALLSVFPLIGALGAGLGFLERFIGPEAVGTAEAAILSTLGTVFATEVTREVFVPLVQGLLREERAGFALGSFLLTIFLASRIFRSAIHTLDVAYRVEERRGTLALWSRGFVFSLGAIVTGVVVLAMLVVGPLLGGGRALADWLGLGVAFELGWEVARGPAVFLVATTFLAFLYRFGPNVRNRWWQTVPGAVFGSVGVVLVSIGFRAYLGVVGVDALGLVDAEGAVVVAARVIGAGLATLLWFWLVSMVLLTGGVLNAEISRLRREVPPPQV